VHIFIRRSAWASTFLLATLYLGGCGKLFGKKESVDAEAIPAATASAATTTDTAPTPTASAAPSTPAITARKLAHGRKANGDCLDGFLPLVQPPGKPTDPCYKSCTKSADCTGGEVCSGEESFAGHRTVCEPPKNKCKGNEVPAGVKGACIKQCVTSNDCTAKLKCLRMAYVDPDGVSQTVHTCLPGGTPEPPEVPTAKPSATAAPSASASASASTAAAGAFKVGDKITVEWKGNNYPATVIAVAGPNQYKIHYDGYGAEWDEVVGPARIRGKR
jgi:hypothetical protein